jgi:hypothetical protein
MGTPLITFGSLGTGDGQFNQPIGIAIDSSDNVYITEWSNHRVQVFNSSGDFLRKWGGYGSGPGQFDKPRTVRIDSQNGNVLVGDMVGGRIQRFDNLGNYLSEVGGAGLGANQFRLLYGFQVDHKGQIWALDRRDSKVKVLDSKGALVFSFGSIGSADGQFSGPSYIDIDCAGFVYVSENGSPTNNNRIQKFNNRGVFVASFNENDSSSQPTFRPESTLHLRNGDVLVTDVGNNRIVHITPVWPTFKQSRTMAFTMTNERPNAVSVDSFGNIYTLNMIGKIRVYSNSGTFLRYMNPGFQPDTMTIKDDIIYANGSVDLGPGRGPGALTFSLTGTYLGTSANGSFNDPDGMAFNSDSHLFLMENGVSEIYEHDSTGSPVRSVMLSGISRGYSLVFDDADNLYVSDVNLGLLIKFDNTFTKVSEIQLGGWNEVSRSLDGLLFISNRNLGLVRIYDPYGNKVSELTFPSPVASVTDKAGTLFVTSNDGTFGNIYVYEPIYDDKVAPKSIFSSSPTTNWSNTNVTATITSTDNAGGSGVKEIHYSINMGAEQIVSSSTATFTITETGTHSISYFAMDNAGNSETTQNATVKIDKIAPVTTLTRDAGLITLSATDAHSGVAKIKYQVNGGAVADYSVPFADTVHKVTYWAEDVAGNSEAAKTDIINAGVQSISVSQPQVTGGVGVIGTVTLDKAAGVGGTVVNLASSLPGVAVVDPTVTVPEGATTATFDIDANPVSVATSVSITATIYETSQIALITVTSPGPVQVTWSTSPVIGGTSTTGTLIISGPAPTGGTTVSLASSSLSAIVGSSVTIPTGAMTASFTVSTNTVSNDTSAIVSATVYGVKLKSTLSILGPKVTSVTLASGSIASTTTTTGTITLSTNAPVGGKVVTLSSSNASVASVPVSVTVAAGTRTATFTVTAGTVNANTNATITATTNGSSGTATLTVTPPPAVLSNVTTNVAAITGGLAVTGTVTLTSAAPTGGAVVTVASSSTTIGTVPASVTVAAGATSATFTITTRTVTGASSLTITAIHNGVSKTAAITVNPVRVVSTLTLNPTSVKGGTNSTGTVTLSGIATEAVVVTLTSGTTTVARVPASVTVPAGSITATFAITTLAQTATRTSIITARTGTTSRTATLSVTR